MIFKKEQFSKGFTLIELLISITILSMLLFTAGYSYRLMSTRWDKELGQFSTSVALAKNFELTQRLLEGIQSFVVTDDKALPFFFFIGHKDSLLAVSQAGFFSDTYPEIFRLTALKNEEGLFDLVYQSASSKDILLKKTEQEVHFTKSLVLFSDLVDVSFRYYGWNSMEEKTDDSGSNLKPQWRDSYSGIDRQYMPSKITLTIEKENNRLVIPVDLQLDVEKWLSPYFNSDT